MPRKSWVFCRHIVKRWVSHGVLPLIASCFLLHTGLDAQVIQTRRILILYETSPSSPLVGLVDQGIQKALDDSPYQIEFHREYLETASFPDPADQQRFHDFYLQKYQHRQPDVIIAVGPAALQFMLDTHKASFPGVPVIFCLPNKPLSGYQVDSDFTGVEADVAPAETLAVAMRLRPDTKHVVVVSGTSPFDRQQRDVVKGQFDRFREGLDISYLPELAMSDLLERLRHLPSHTIIILSALGWDAAGNRFTLAQSGPLVVAAANAPVFVLNDRNLNHGEVGGDVSNALEQGRVAGRMAKQMLNGAKPKDIPAVKSATTYMFDARALRRWGIKESALPPGSIVLNHQSTVWELYRLYIIGGISLILVEALLIFGLLRQREKRRALNHTLEQQTALLQSREELLKTFVKNVPAGVVMLDNNMHYLQVSNRWCADYSLESSQILGRSHYELFPDIPQRWKEMHRRALSGETLRGEESWERESGGVKWVRWELHPWRTSSGNIGGMLILAEDITQRKQMEDAISSMSRKLLEALEEERSRIGRELHDDVNQRLALIAIELGRLRNDPSDIHTRLEALRLQTIGLSRDVQGLSHELHSTKLRYLGVVPAVQGWCTEFAERQNVDIQFRSDVSSAVPLEVGFCLLRVLQEALGNAAKHGGAKQIEVQLTDGSGEVHMIVSDSGAGFNTETAQQGNGIGLSSMRERVRLVRGSIVIDSKPLVGTTVHIRIPLNSEDAWHKAAG